VLGISTDKACKPVNVMGMTKAIQERIFTRANLECPETRFLCVRYGNVLASRGSVIPLFHEQIRKGGPVTITTVKMTRFLLSLNQAVDLIFNALYDGNRGETYVPQVPSARIIDVAAVLIGEQPIETVMTGVRPGEKTHEILISEEEMFRTIVRDNCYVILPGMAELRHGRDEDFPLSKEYSSADYLLTQSEIRELLARHDLLFPGSSPTTPELLR
jgi:FlaA1/EpsC-like NDP-sugar epimerase